LAFYIAKYCNETVTKLPLTYVLIVVNLYQVGHIKHLVKEIKMKEITKAARFKKGALKDGTEFKSWLTTCPFPTCSKAIEHAEECAPDEIGFSTVKDVRCEHARYFHDNGEVTFAK
jgi:hypothetical protein